MKMPSSMRHGQFKPYLVGAILQREISDIVDQIALNSVDCRDPLFYI